MNGHFRWRQFEDEPAPVGIDVRELQDILDERFVCSASFE